MSSRIENVKFSRRKTKKKKKIIYFEHVCASAYHSCCRLRSPAPFDEHAATFKPANKRIKWYLVKRKLDTLLQCIHIISADGPYFNVLQSHLTIIQKRVTSRTEPIFCFHSHIFIIKKNLAEKEEAEEEAAAEEAADPQRKAKHVTRFDREVENVGITRARNPGKPAPAPLVKKVANPKGLKKAGRKEQERRWGKLLLLLLLRCSLVC